MAEETDRPAVIDALAAALLREIRRAGDGYPSDIVITALALASTAILAGALSERPTAKILSFPCPPKGSHWLPSAGDTVWLGARAGQVFNVFERGGEPVIDVDVYDGRGLQRVPLSALRPYA